MSELHEKTKCRQDFRKYLLVTVSGLSLLGSKCAVLASDLDVDRPTVWLELGGQLEGMSTQEEHYTPNFVPSIVQAGFDPPEKFQTPPRFSNGAEGKISFQPEGTRWIFTASLRYGRANGVKDIHQQTVQKERYITGLGTVAPSFSKFVHYNSQHKETHAILDFQTGKDVGLGLFGTHGKSVLSAGVRIAQFNDKSVNRIDADPDLYYNSGNLFKYPKHHHIYAGYAHSERSFRGIGPSVDWSGSTPIGGDPESAMFALDWTANVAVLFGKQRAKVHDQTTAHYYYNRLAKYRFPTVTAHSQQSADHSRSRSVVIPNVGGSAGVSMNFPNAKISVGYRADFFFGAMDGGIDTRRTYDRNFYGPFATISIDLGG